MDVVEGLASLRPDHGRLFVVVGVFDGLHRGHAYLLRRLVAEARRRRARPAVITFDSHPEEVLTGSAPPLLLDPEERLVRLAAAGVEVTVVQHFDRALRETTYEGFVRMITDRTALAGFLMTPDAAFGYQRAGTPATLAALGAASEPPFDVAVVPPFDLEGRHVRSSDIRAAIAAGELDHARLLLGRAHAVVGDVGEDGHVMFSMPVALPPDGEYEVRVGTPFAARAWRGRPAVARVGEGLELEGARGARRVRIAFTGG